MTDCVTRTGDDKTMWLVTLPEIITNNSTRQEENLVVILSREESWGPTSDHFPDGLYRVSCIMTLYLADTELTKTQTFTAIYWPQQKALHLFTDEFRLERRLQGLGLGSWITQQFVLWARGLPPATLVLPIEISRVDEENEENKIRRDRLWHAMGFRFPAGETSSMPLRADELQLPRGRCSTLRVEPLVSAVRRLEDCYRGLQEKIVQLEGKKRSQKQLITSLKNRPFYHLLHRKEGQLPARNVTPCRCGQKNCLCRRAGIQTWRWRNGQPGSSGWLPCVLSRRKESWSWKGSLPRKVRSSLTCRHIPFLTCGINTAARSCSGDGGWVFCALSTGCWCHECSRSIATH